VWAAAAVIVIVIVVVISGDVLLVSCIDSCHYLYRLTDLDRPPSTCLQGHVTNSFCIRSCFSPDGRHVLSGSSDRSAYIWDVSG
jgi:denticleless